MLDAFATVSDKLRELLASLEASTFVKRLKLASRKQMAVAKALNTTTLDAFGLDKKKVEEKQAKQSAEIASKQTEESGTIRVIQSDLEAYYQRKQDMRFKNILEQMKKTEVVAAVARICATRYAPRRARPTRCRRARRAPQPPPLSRRGPGGRRR